MNNKVLHAERAGIIEADVDGKSTRVRLSVIDCGLLNISTGRLTCCDPFVFLERKGNPHITVPTGDFPVSVTVADVSDKLDGSHTREAYATIRFLSQRGRIHYAEMSESGGRIFTEGWDEDEMKGFPVDAGTGCFVDDGNVVKFMAKVDDWYKDLFENEDSACWFARMDDKAHIRDGVANITLPGATTENIVIFHSGWGDGVYPIYAEVDEGRLCAIHIDFSVV